MYTNNPCKAKHQLLINKCEGVGLRHCNDQNTFIEYFNKMDDVYKNNEECNPAKGQKLLIVFDDMIADMNSAKKTSTNSKRTIYWFSLLNHTLQCQKVLVLVVKVLIDYECSKRR